MGILDLYGGPNAGIPQVGYLPYNLDGSPTKPLITTSPGNNPLSDPYGFIKNATTGLGGGLGNALNVLTSTGILGAISNEIAHSLVDVVRIGKYLYTQPSGWSWLTTQQPLQLLNSDLPKPISTISSEGIKSLLYGYGPLGPSTNRVYNPVGINTLLNVATQGVGYRLERTGLVPNFNTGFALGSNYDYAAVSYGNSLLGTDRPTDYIQRLISNGSGYYTTTIPGGPKSILGIGYTTYQFGVTPHDLYIGVADNKNILFDKTHVYNIQNQLNGFTPLPFSKVYEIGLQPTGNYIKNVSGSTWVDFSSISSSQTYLSSASFDRLQKNTSISSSQTYLSSASFDRLQKNNRETRLGVVAPGYVDSINMIRIKNDESFYQNSGGKNNIVDFYNTDEKINGTYGNDLIKFRIEVYNNNDADNTTEVLTFRAYISSLSDNFSPQWDEYSYVGRGETFYTYNKTTRKMDFEFTALAHTPSEMKAIYQKINYLVSSVYADYSRYSLPRGNFIKLTVGDYIYRQPCIINSLSTTPISEQTTWEIAIDDDNNLNELPIMLKTKLSVTVIHDFLPRRVYADNISEAPFVTPRDSKTDILEN